MTERKSRKLQDNRADYDIRIEDKLGLISTPEKLKYPNLMMLNIRKECLTPEK